MRRRPPEPETVLLTVRARTSDGADLRLLLEAAVRPSPGVPPASPERVVHALVVPALERWVERRSLASLTEEIEDSMSGVAANLRSELGELGTDLLRLDLTAVEHLLLSPSAITPARVDGSR